MKSVLSTTKVSIPDEEFDNMSVTFSMSHPVPQEFELRDDDTGFRIDESFCNLDIVCNLLGKVVTPEGEKVLFNLDGSLDYMLMHSPQDQGAPSEILDLKAADILMFDQEKYVDNHLAFDRAPWFMRDSAQGVKTAWKFLLTDMDFRDTYYFSQCVFDVYSALNSNRAEAMEVGCRPLWFLGFDHVMVRSGIAGAMRR